MNDFIEKWKNDSKFKAKVQLLIYAAVVIIMLLFAFLSGGSSDYNEKLSEIKSNIKTSIKIPAKYTYTIEINKNNTKYRYEGTITENKETITKITDLDANSYIKVDNIYHQGTSVMNSTVSKEEIYNVIEYSYLNLETINKYLSVSKREDDIYKAYLRDIIIGHESEKYITFKIEGKKINIDYTSLLQLFDQSIENCNIEYIIEESE